MSRALLLGQGLVSPETSIDMIENVPGAGLGCDYDDGMWHACFLFSWREGNIHVLVAKILLNRVRNVI